MRRCPRPEAAGRLRAQLARRRCSPRPRASHASSAASSAAGARIVGNRPRRGRRMVGLTGAAARGAADRRGAAIAGVPDRRIEAVRPKRARAQPPQAEDRRPASATARASSSRNEASRAASHLQNDLGARADQRREPHRVPVGQADAAVRFGVADARRLRRAVNAVVLLARSIHDHADRVVRTGRDLRLRVRRVRRPRTDRGCS